MASQTIEKILKHSIFIGLLLLITLIFSQKVEFTSIDLGRHLENGKIVWQNPQILFTNFYSYTEPNFPFTNHHWLAGVIFYAVYQINGFPGLSAFNALIALITFVLFFNLAKKRAGFYIPAILSIPIIFLLSERVQIRPEIFSYLFIAITWHVLDRVTEKKNYHLLYWLIPIFVLWVNIHSYFFLGLVLIGFKTMENFLSAFWMEKGSRRGLAAGWMAAKNWLIPLALLALVCLINPNFLNGWLYPFNIFHKLGYDVTEGHSVFYLEKLLVDHNIQIFKAYLLFLSASWMIYWIVVRRLKLFNLLVTILFTGLAVIAIRNITIFGLVSLVLISDNLAIPIFHLRRHFPTLKLARLYGATVILILIGVGAWYLIKDSGRNNNFIKSNLGWGLRDGNDGVSQFWHGNNLHGPIFNNYDIGSALIFWLYPEEKVFVDNRPEAYDQSFFTNVYAPTQLDPNKWKELNSQYGFKAIIFTHTDNTVAGQTFLQHIISDPNWSLVYFDRSSIVFLNKLNNDQNLIKKLTLTKDDIASRIQGLAASSDLRSMNQLAYFANLIGRPDLAIDISHQVLAIYPNNRYALSALGLIYFNSQDKNNLLKALDFFNKSAQAGNKLPGVYDRIGLIYWQLGNNAQAERNFNNALGFDKKDEVALYYLSEINKTRFANKLWLDYNFPSSK